jgi:hypothetical protein
MGIDTHCVMPAKAGMTAMDTQNTRDARGAGSGGNAIGLQGATLAYYSDASETLRKHCSMDTCFRRHDA